MRAAKHLFLAAVVLAGTVRLSVPTPASREARTGSPPGRKALILMFADQDIYLCPACGEHFLADYRRSAALQGEDRIWVIYSPERDPQDHAPAESWAAAMKRIKMYLSIQGCRAPILLDSVGAFRTEGGLRGRGLVLDPSSGSVENFSIRTTPPRRQHP